MLVVIGANRYDTNHRLFGNYRYPNHRRNASESVKAYRKRMIGVIVNDENFILAVD